jgi:hypothetical protein
LFLSLWFDDDEPDAAAAIAAATAMELLNDLTLSKFAPAERGGEPGELTGLDSDGWCNASLSLTPLMMFGGLLALETDTDAELVDAKGESRRFVEDAVDIFLGGTFPSS